MVPIHHDLNNSLQLPHCSHHLDYINLLLQLDPTLCKQEIMPILLFRWLFLTPTADKLLDELKCISLDCGSIKYHPQYG